VAITARLEAGPMTIADLARAESMKPQSMCASLAQMEEEGVVRRWAHSSDGRQILFELTPADRRGDSVRASPSGNGCCRRSPNSTGTSSRLCLRSRL
jgi:DNA-binding MarR family transcriptional regulator